MPTTPQDFPTALSTQVDREALQAAAEAKGTSPYGYVLQGIEGAQSSIGSLSTSTSTGLSGTNSALSSLSSLVSTLSATDLTPVNSAVASLSTSTSTALSSTNSTVAALAPLPTGLGTQWYATTYTKQVSQTIPTGSTVSLASLVTDADRTSFVSDANLVYKNPAGFFQLDPISGNTKEDISLRLRLDISFAGGDGTDLEFGVQLVRADGADLGALTYVKVQDSPIKPTRRIFIGDTFASGALDAFYTQGFDVRILNYSGQNITINNLAGSVQFKVVRNPEIIPVSVSVNSEYRFKCPSFTAPAFDEALSFPSQVISTFFTANPIYLGFSPTNTGTNSGPVPSAANPLAAMPRFRTTSATTAGSSVYSRNNTTVLLSSGAIGGFYFAFNFGISDAAPVAGARLFVGLRSDSAAPANVEPSTLTNHIGVGHGAADTNLKLYLGGASAMQVIDLGADFPIGNTGNAYRLIVYNPNTTLSASPGIGWAVQKLGTSIQADGYAPLSTIGLAPGLGFTMHWHRQNNATALAVSLDIGSVYLQAFV